MFKQYLKIISKNYGIIIFQAVWFFKHFGCGMFYSKEVLPLLSHLSSIVQGNIK
jgi:hypothetical protein